MALVPPRARSIPEKASRCRRPPCSPSPRAGTRHVPLYFRQQRGEIEARTFTPRTEFGDLRGFQHRSVGLVSFPASPGKTSGDGTQTRADGTREPWGHCHGVPGPRGGPSRATLGWGAQLGAQPPRNSSSSSSLPFPADLCLDFGFTPGTEQKLQQGVWMPAVRSAAPESQGVNYTLSGHGGIQPKRGRRFKKGISHRWGFQPRSPSSVPRGHRAQAGSGCCSRRARAQSPESALPTGQALFPNTQESAGWRLHPSWKSLEPGGDAGEHPPQASPRDLRLEKPFPTPCGS